MTDEEKTFYLNNSYTNVQSSDVKQYQYDIEIEIDSLNVVTYSENNLPFSNEPDGKNPRTIIQNTFGQKPSNNFLASTEAPNKKVRIDLVNETYISSVRVFLIPDYCYKKIK